MNTAQALIAIHNLLPESLDDVILAIPEEEDLFEGLEANYSNLLVEIWAILNSFPPGALEAESESGECSQ